MNKAASIQSRRHQWGHLFLVVVLGAGCGTTSSQPEFDSELASRLQGVLDKSVTELEIPGVVLAIRDPDGATWTGSSGHAEVAGAELIDGTPAGGVDLPMSLDMHFHIGSLTKTFTATVVLQLVDEGKIGLDDTLDQVIQKWMPKYFDFAIPFADTITVRNLLAMRSGMGNYSYASEFHTAANADPLRKWEPKTLVRYGVESKDTPAYAPDTKFEYNNGNYILLGIFIEQITGSTYTAEIDQRLLKPLQMTHTSVPADASMPAPYAHGYKYDDAQNVLLDVSSATDPSWGWAAGSMVSTARDLLTWVAAMVDGTSISPAQQKERLRLQSGDIHDVGTIKYGLGIYDDNGAVGHGGDYSGLYTAYGVRYAGYDIAVLENGIRQQTKNQVGIPARTVFFSIADALAQ